MASNRGREDYFVLIISFTISLSYYRRSPDGATRTGCKPSRTASD